MAKYFPYSTSGVGFAVCDLYYRFRNDSFANHCTIFQLYRYTLAQLELQAYHAQDRHVGSYPIADFHFEIESNLKSCISGYTENFKILVHLIEACGISKDDKQDVSVGLLAPPAVFSPHTIPMPILKKNRKNRFFPLGTFFFFFFFFGP